MIYRGYQGGLLLLNHNKHAFPGNISKIPTPVAISPYLQIVRIANLPLQPWLLINIYMPSHEEDLPLIPTIQNTITDHINSHPNHTYILCGDFNRDIALIGRQNNLQTTPSQTEDYQWRFFTTGLELSYILTNTIFSRQGGYNYTQNNLINGFFIKTPNNNQYTSTTTQHTHLNSDHFPIQLKIPANTFITKPPPKLLNPIPKDKIENFHIKFFESNSNHIDELIILLEHNHLTNEQWQIACNSLNTLTDNITTTVLETCTVPPIPILPNKIANQGGYLPKKPQKLWKTHLSTYHLVRKIIYIIKNNPNWRTHPIITHEISNHTYATISPPPNPSLPHNSLIEELARIAKEAKNKARKITTEYTTLQVKKTISKYQQLYDKSPKIINRKVFNNTNPPPLDCLIDRFNNILTSPQEIAHEIHVQQSISNRPTVPTCSYQPDHTQHCICGVRQYPWHDLHGYTIEKRGEASTSLHTYLDQQTYDLCLKNLINGKTPGPDKIPNTILKSMPPRFHKLLLLFFTHCYKQKQIPASWKISLTILLYKKGSPHNLPNYKPIVLANTIYKLFTSTLISILFTYGEKYQILHDSQEGFRTERCTARQLQIRIAALEDARFTNQNIYILYINFKNAFGSIDHARLLAIIKDLGYPQDAVALFGNIYSHSTTTFIGDHFVKTQPIPIQRGTIQGDTLSPYLFIIFLEPLLRWLQRGNNEYTFNTSNTTICSAAYADDLAAISNNLPSLQHQLNEIDKFREWAGMNLGIPKCAITGCPNKTKLNPQAFKSHIQNTNIHFRN